jgi:hypothetical protein
MRKKLIVVLLLLLFICVGSTYNNKISISKPTLQKEKSLNLRVIQDENFLIDGKDILNLKYAELIKIWGEPEEIKQVKVNFPATVEKVYSYIMKYDSIEIEMYPEKKDISIVDTTSFRFDITGNKYDFYGVKLGMSIGKYLNRIENKDVFSVKELLSDSKNEKFPDVYRKLLTSVKEKNYYYDYDKAIYEMVVINGFPYGAVMLFKDDILERIVYGYPNAS